MSRRTMAAPRCQERDPVAMEGADPPQGTMPMTFADVAILLLGLGLFALLARVEAAE